MKKLFSLSVLLLFLCSCGSGDIDKAKSVSEEWIKETVLPLYSESDNPVILSSKKEIEAQANSKYLAKKYKWKGAFEDNGYDFLENSKQATLFAEIRLFSAENASSLEVDERNYNAETNDRARELLESSDCEIKLHNLDVLPKYFYVVRFYVRYNNKYPSNVRNKYSYDRLDVVLDDKFNVINEL